MSRLQKQVAKLQRRIESARTDEERRAAVEDVAIIAELAHAERDRVLENAARRVLAEVGA